MMMAVLTLLDFQLYNWAFPLASMAFENETFYEITLFEERYE